MGDVRSMNVMLDTDECVTVVCTREELDMLESGLYCYISEYTGVCDEYVDLCQRLLTDIANMRMM